MTSSPIPSDASLQSAHVVVVGAGGLGCPAAWALAEAGVGRLTVIDPDLVELSNLPRQVLYREADVGRPKALVAAERLARFDGRVEGHRVRLDDECEARLLEGADVLVDATDGASTKDWLNAVAVRRDVPLIHAASLRAEGRLLEVPAAGRPCLACLFGRLTQEPGGTCADLGVWGGVVGAVGFLAAAAALRRLAEPRASSPGYVVLDVEGGRAFTLGADAAAGCPVCGPDAPHAPEPYPAPAACEAPAVDAQGDVAQGSEAQGVDAQAGDAQAGDAQAGDAQAGDAPAGNVRGGDVRERGARAEADIPPMLDLVDESCPMNLLRARREVEALAPGGTLEIHLGAEGAGSVPDGLRALGHAILEETPPSDRSRAAYRLRLLVRRGTVLRSDVPLTRDELLRYARQVVLPDVGQAGQRRLLQGAVEVAGAGPVAETAAVYLRAAGVGRVAHVKSGGPAGSARHGAETLPRVTVELGGGRAVLGLGAAADGRLGIVRRAGSDAADASDGEGADPTRSDPSRTSGPVARALGALLADAACRLLVAGSGKGEPPAIVLGRDGTIASRSSSPASVASASPTSLSSPGSSSSGSSSPGSSSFGSSSSESPSSGSSPPGLP